MNGSTLLVDTNVIIEAVRTGCWRAITGRMNVETVETCTHEAVRGDAGRSGYVVVSEEELSRLSGVHAVTETQRAALALDYPDAAGMDAGERDLFAHAYGRSDETWLLLSPDKASIRAGVSLGWQDRLRSLGAVANEIGARPKLKRPFRRIVACGVAHTVPARGKAPMSGAVEQVRHLVAAYRRFIKSSGNMLQELGSDPARSATRRPSSSSGAGLGGARTAGVRRAGTVAS